MTGRQIVFHSGESRYTDDAIVSPLYMKLLSGALPTGMFATLTIYEPWQGKAWAITTRQARSKHGRRHDNFYGDNAASDAQESLMRWAARILRERKA